MADLATDSYDREFSLGLASNDRDLLAQINDALKKYGRGKIWRLPRMRQTDF